MEKMSDQKDEIPHDIHDRSYKLFFSFSKLFQQLIQDHVNEAWKEKIDYSRCLRIEKSFIFDDLKKLESDILYKAPLIGEEGKEIYLYILIEHQSSIDYSIAFRVLVYLVNIWQDIYKNLSQDERTQKNFSLPPVFPIVIYNGAATWTVPKTLKEIIESNELFGEYIPNLKYHLVDVSHYDFEKLKKLDDTLASIFMIETQAPSNLDDPNNFIKTINKAIRILKKEQDDDLFVSIATWFLLKIQYLHPNLPEQLLTQITEKLTTKPTRKELLPMLETNLRQVFNQLEQRGIQTGIQTGIQRSLIKALTCRFGKIPETIISQINTIDDQEELEKLLEKSITVSTLAEFKKCLSAKK